MVRDDVNCDKNVGVNFRDGFCIGVVVVNEAIFKGKAVKTVNDGNHIHRITKGVNFLH